MTLPRERRLVTWLGVTVSPMLVAVVVTFAVAMAMLHEVARVVRRSQEVRYRADVVRAHIAAEAALVQRCAAAAGEQAVPGDAAVVTSVEGGPQTMLVEVRLPEGACHWFEGRELSGAAPMAFGRPFASTSEQALSRISGGLLLDAVTTPRFDQNAVARAVRADTMPAFRRDQGVALQHWQAGTDGDDFVLGRGKRIELAAAGNLIVVPGHLWIEPCAAPLEIHLQTDLVIVVRGNLYVGRSLRVVGGGRLLLATAVPDGASAFVDRDCNGRWSEGDALLDRPRFAGQIEGGGNVYVGHAGSGARIECDVGVFVRGELHVRVDSRLAGPLVLAHGVTFVCATARVCAAGEWRFDPERERVPGFVTSGPARPSLLRYAGGKRPPVPKQALYLSVPAR